MTLVDAGLWCDIGEGAFAGRPALFLDRDGVVVVDTNYLGRAEDLQMIAGSAAAIARCNALKIPVVLVTNQSGIGRGYYDWKGFAAVQAAIAAELRHAGAHFDAVLACAYHRDGKESLRVGNHPWRKPNPGMVLTAAQRMGLDLPRSWIVGDRVHDLAAGRSAGLAGGTLLTDDGRDTQGASQGADVQKVLALAEARFSVDVASNLADAVTKLLAKDRFGTRQ